MTHKEGTSGELRVQYIDDLGVTSQSIVKENISNTRIAGLPQMVLHDENIVLAWTGGSNVQKSVEVKKTRLNALK